MKIKCLSIFDSSLFTWGSMLYSSCIAEVRRGSKGVLVAANVGSAAPVPWVGRGQQPLHEGQEEQGRRSRKVETNLERTDE